MDNPTNDKRIVGLRVVLLVLNKATEKVEEEVAYDQKILPSDTIDLAYSRPATHIGENWVQGPTSTLDIHVVKHHPIPEAL